jgi:hypothetical protein
MNLYGALCVVCDHELPPMGMAARYVCCNGRDCGCYGAVLPSDVCSTECYEAQQDRDPTPWCSGCGAMRKANCHCGPIADND